MSDEQTGELTPEELDAINERQMRRAEEIARQLQDEEHARIEAYLDGRDEGPGVTPGVATLYADPGVIVGRVGDIRHHLIGPDVDILADESVNPKQQAATRDQKPPLHLLEHAADVEIAKVLAHGAHKYGRKNFHDTPILANVYGGAIRRHVGAWLDGEDIDPESGFSHLAHIGANIHVLFAAMAHGTFEDDRGPESRSAVQQRMSDASNASRP